MFELIIATGDELVHAKPQNGQWHAKRLPTGGGMQCLAADPRHRDHLYAGSHGEGVWKSLNCGGQWRQLEFPEDEVSSLAVSPVDGAVSGNSPSRVLAVIPIPTAS